ncbi:hypothetical protein [Streptomyces sp. NPDC058989]|uniref:hypothetical protein n=1 Tax=Streptomyces sp. NPDC058989 TaxID=3346686 RepID=UPI0036B907A9
MPTTAPTVWEGFEVPAHARGGQVTLNLMNHLAAHAPKRPGASLRIPSDRFGLEAGVDRQLEDAEDTRARLRWGPFVKVFAVDGRYPQAGFSAARRSTRRWIEAWLRGRPGCRSALARA